MAENLRGRTLMKKTAKTLMLAFFLSMGFLNYFAFFMIYRLIRGFVREDLKPDSFPGLRGTWAYWAAIFREPALVPSPRPMKVNRPHTFRRSPPPSDHKWRPGRPLILVNESDDNLREFIAYLLNCEGYRVVLGKDGEEAIELSHTLLPDLLIINALLGKKHGGVVREELKEDPRTAGIKVLLLSGQRSLVSFLTEPEGFVEKPFDVQELLREVARLIGPPAGR